MWILEADGTPGEPRGPTWSQDLGGGRDLEARDADSVVEHARAVSRSAAGGRVGHLHRRHRQGPGGQPRLVNKKEVIRARRPECTLEAQDFRRNDTELIYTCYRTPYADVFGVDLGTGAVTVYRKIAGEYNEVEGIFPDGEHALVESSRDQIQHDSNYIDIWKLKLEPASTDFVRMTRWGEYPGFKASNPVVSPDGRRIAFQSARSKDAAGVGYGIFVMQVP